MTNPKENVFLRNCKNTFLLSNGKIFFNLERFIIDLRLQVSNLMSTTIRTKIALAAALIMLSAFNANASQQKKLDGKGYKFTLTINGNHDTVMYLGNYYAGQTFAIDTARRDRRGNFVFEKKNRELMPGMYFFTNPDGNYVEFMVYNETPRFSFTTDEKGWASHLTVKGSKENELMIDFQRENRKAYSDIDSALRLLGANSDDFKLYRRNRMHSLDSLKEAMIAEHPSSMLALMMNATREPSVPRTDSAGNQLTHRQQWEYYMEHYFDYMRIDDNAIVRTPERIFRDRITFYLDSCLHNASAEMICEYVDKMIEKSRPAKEVFRYLVYTIADKYLKTNVMSYDAVYVHMVKKYMETGDCFWMSPSSIDLNVKRAEKWERLLIGKPAQELILRDIDGQPQSLYAQKHKYELLIFWSPTCGHCKVVIPSLYRKFIQYKDMYDIGAFAILSEPDDETRPKWHDFIKEYNLQWLNLDGGEANVDWHELYDIETTPQIYLLDKDKKILAKRLNAETFELVLQALERNNQPQEQ